MNEPRILVVDDEPQIQRFLSVALSAAGFRVQTAETGAQALRLAATGAPDLIVLDLGLPDRTARTSCATSGSSRLRRSSSFRRAIVRRRRSRRSISAPTITWRSHSASAS